MAESGEDLSDESSDIFEATSPEYSTSSESSSEEATHDNSAMCSSWGKGKTKKKASNSSATKLRVHRRENKHREMQETTNRDAE